MAGNFWCIGRSYAEHAKELGNTVPTEPLVFLKAASCLVPPGKEIALPNSQDEFHHEVEMAILLDSSLNPSHYACSLDLTNRSQQEVLKKKGHPWTLAKSFRQSACLGPWVAIENTQELAALEIELFVNQELRQKSNTQMLIFEIPFLLDYLVKHFPLMPNDIILTGTPSGVGPILPGDELHARVGKSSHSWKLSL